MRVTPPHAPIATQIQSPLLPDQESNLSIKDSDIPQISPGQSRFSSFGRLSSPILPLPLNLMDLEGLEGLLVEPVSC